MASFDGVNYSLRPNKHIQRTVVFERALKIKEQLDLDELVFIGLGSIWLVDFQMAHKLLHIDQLISIESDEIGAMRARFNKPYKCVEILEGLSSQKLKECIRREDLKGRPWFVWLDYDTILDSTVKEDMAFLIENAPSNSIVIATFDANHKHQDYGSPKELPGQIRGVLGDVVPDDLSVDACTESKLVSTLSELLVDHMHSTSTTISRIGGFIPAFRIHYKDGPQMATVGGILPSKESAAEVQCLVAKEEWGTSDALEIRTPLLTNKEASTLQAQLPSETPLTRELLQEIGFDLQDEQLKAYEAFYKYYPSFARVAT